MLVYSAEFKYFILLWNCLCGCGDQRNVDSTFVSVLYDLIFCLGNLCWHFICGLIHTHCWFDVVCVSKEMFVGFVGVAVVNGLRTC